MSFVGIGGGFNLGIATGYLFVDATGVRNGLNQAASAFDQFKSKVDARSAQAVKSTDAAAKASASAALGAASTQARLASNQSAVVSATANATAQITRSYETRGKAISALSQVQKTEDARVQKAEQIAQTAVQKRDALEAKLNAKKDLRLQVTDPAAVTTLNKQIAGITSAYNKSVTVAGNANRSLAAIRASASKNIADESKKQQGIIEGANKSQAAATAQAVVAINNQIRAYNTLASGQGVAAQRAATAVQNAGRSQIRALQDLEVAQRKVAAAQQHVDSSTGADKADAVAELERASLARDKAADRAIQARNRQVLAEKNASQVLQTISARNQATADKEAAKLTADLKAEELARKAAVSQNLGTVTQSLAVVGIATAAVLSQAIKQFAEFDEAIHNVASISTDASYALGVMADHIQKLSVITGQGPTDLAKTLYDVVSSGFDGAQALQLVDVSAKAAVAGLSDVSVAGKAFTAVLNAFKNTGKENALTIANLGHVSDVAFQAVKDGVFSFQELTSQQGDNLAIAAELGIKYEELNAAYVVLTRRGNSLSESTTQLNGIMRTFIKPNEDLAAAIRSYGQEVLGVSNLTGAGLLTQYGFGAALKFVSDVAGDDADALGRLFPNVRALRGEVALSGQGLVDYNTELATLKSSSEGVGATQKTFEIQTKSLQFALNQAKESFRVAAIQIGSSFAPALIGAAHAAVLVGQSISTLNADTHGVVGGIAGIGTATFIALGVMVRLGSAAKSTFNALKALKELEVFDSLMEAGRGVVSVIETMIARMQVFLATATLAQLALAGGLAIAALAGIAYITSKVIASHKKEEVEVQKLTQLYQDLNNVLNSPSARLDPKRIAVATEQQKILDQLTDSIKSQDDQIQAALTHVGELTDKLSQASLAAGGGAAPAGKIIDPNSLSGPTSRTGPRFIDAQALGARLEAAKLTVAEVETITQNISDLLNTTGIDLNKAGAAVDGLVESYIKSIQTGTAQADADENLIAGIQALTSDTALYTTGLIGASEATDDLSDYITDAAERSEQLRQGLISIQGDLYKTTGVFADANDPLAVLTQAFGQTGDSAEQMLLKLDDLNTNQLADFVAGGTGDLNAFQHQFNGLDLSEAQRQTLKVVDALNKADAALDKTRKRLQGIQQDESNYSSIQDQVRASIGDESDGYAALNALLQSGAIDQKQYNEIKQAGIFLFEDAQNAIDKDNKSEATGLITLAKRTDAQEKAQASYDALSDSQKAFADNMKDENFLMGVNLVLMSELLVAQGKLPEQVPVEIATNIASVLPGFGEFINDTDLLNGKTISTTLTLEADPALQTIEGVQTAIDQTTAAIAAYDDAIQAAKVNGQDDNATRLIEEQNQAKQNLLTLQGIRAEMTADAGKTPTPTGSLAGIPGVPTDDDVQAAKRNFETIADYFQTPIDAANDLDSTVSGMIKDVESSVGTLGDVSDPIKFLNKQLDITGQGLAGILLESQRQGFTVFSDADRDALKLQARIDSNNRDLAKLNDTFDKANDKVSQYNDLLDTLDDVLGTADDGYAELYQEVRAGLLTDDEAAAALEAGNQLRDDANYGILQQRALIAKGLPALRDYTAEHERLNYTYDQLPDNEKGFLAALQDEGTQTAINTILTLKMLEALGAIPEGVTTRFIADVSQANPVIGAVLDDIGIAKEGATIPLKTKADAGSTNTATTDIKNGVPETVTTTIKVKGPDLEALKAQFVVLEADAVVYGNEAGSQFDDALASGLDENTAVIMESWKAIVLALITLDQQVYQAGRYLGFRADDGVAQGMYDNNSVVSKAAQYVAGVVLTSMIARLRVSSPSKETREIGGFATLGLAQGILDKANAAAAAGTHVARTAGEAMREEAKRQQDLLDAAGGLVRDDQLARKAVGFRPVSGSLGVRDLSSLTARPGFVGASSTVTTHQTNQITVPVSGAGDPEATGRAVVAAVNDNLKKLLSQGRHK